MSAQDILSAGRKILETTLAPIGFKYVEGPKGSSGGDFASGSSLKAIAFWKYTFGIPSVL